jgi:hypothetical protein
MAEGFGVLAIEFVGMAGLFGRFGRAPGLEKRCTQRVGSSFWLLDMIFVAARYSCPASWT